MDTDALNTEIRSLRARGFSPKEIARVLRIAPSVAARLVREAATDEAAAVTEHPVLGCWVNAGWSRGLIVDSRPGWPPTDDGEADSSVGGFGGMASVLIARDTGRSRVSVCGYLVDVYCLGVKNVLGPELMNSRQSDALVRRFFGGNDDPPIAVPLDLAQNIVLGAVDYARGLGFEPYHEFAAAREHLGSWVGPGSITFGCEGRPYYIQGPFDDADGVMRRLERAAGSGKFHYLVSA